MAPIGFLGLGVMGQPMALRLVEAGHDLLVWNRSTDRAVPLVQRGARQAARPEEVFHEADVVLTMLTDGEALDHVIGRSTPRFASQLRGRLLVTLGTTSPEYSRRLAADVAAVGGQLVESPVSGSRLPAERGELVAMLAGEPGAVDRVRPLLEPLTRRTVVCGQVPAALTTKLAVNLFLITLVSGLAESYHFAARHGVDLSAYREVLDEGPMASPVSTLKLAKLLARDFAVQASIRDVHYNTRLIAEAGRQEAVPTPLLDQCRRLFAATESSGHGHLDMAAVVLALESLDPPA